MFYFGADGKVRGQVALTAKGVGVARASAMGQIMGNSRTRRADRETYTHRHDSKAGAGVEEERVEEQDLGRHHRGWLQADAEGGASPCRGVERQNSSDSTIHAC